MQQSDTGSLNVDKFMAWAQDPANKDYTSAATIHAITRANMASLAHQHKALEKEQIRGAVMASEHEAKSRVDARLGLRVRDVEDAESSGHLYSLRCETAKLLLTGTGEKP